MKRKAILIFNDGGPSNFLPGVKIDKKNYLRFLKSPEGGAWEDDEIKIYDNDCSKVLLSAYINAFRISDRIDFWLIIFSGHGYSNDLGETILELSPGQDCPVNEIKRFTEYSRCLLIADSCRKTFHNISESLKAERKLFSDSAVGSKYRELCRNLYFKQLDNVYRISFSVAFAAEFDQVAYDDDVNGGFYSCELLKEADNVIDVQKSLHLNEDYVMPFKSIHDVARQEVIKRTKGKQSPVCDGYNLRVLPFIVIPKV